jgi:ketosteroid isomerase-like protein
MSTSTAFERYQASLAAGDMGALAAALHPRVTWHQPGGNPLSGDHVGPDAVLALLGRFMQLSAGTFALNTTSQLANGDMVATTVAFSASRDGRPALAQRGIDVFRVEDDLIAEVWLFSEDQAAEDAFWG